MTKEQFEKCKYCGRESWEINFDERFVKKNLKIGDRYVEDWNNTGPTAVRIFIHELLRKIINQYENNHQSPAN